MTAGEGDLHERGVAEVARLLEDCELRIAVVRGDSPCLIDAGADLIVSERVEKALLPTLRAVAAGRVALPGSTARRTVSLTLSHRERQVLRLVVEGMTNDAIARTLFLSVSTVKSHLTSAFSKLAVRSRSEATAVLLDPDEPANRLVFGGLDSPRVALAAVGGER